MTSVQWKRLEELFEEALACKPEERASFLAKACGEDGDLRSEVERLLAQDRQAPPDFMRPPGRAEGIRGIVATDACEPLVGTTLGAYKIKSVIASGGMGTVYLAEQTSPRRDVALKVMRSGIASRSALRRFEYESQILAHLRHPNIAQVFEAGTHSPSPSEGVGRGEGEGHSVPYFAMEYIPDARPITQYAAQERLPTRRRLELFAQVCEAVHHGHQKGIIHRDLKPANVLVDGSGRVKIIDFGVAKLTDSDIALTTLQTDIGQIIGTLQYMSPEQCEADPHEIDTRSDVYALGVVLYELLCGRLPYDVTGRGIASAARVISEKPPTRPSTIDRRLRGDLEMIVLKALKKDREDRYQSAADLSQDLRRYLSGDPIEARPPTAWTRGVRWVTRHPAITTAASCSAIATMLVVAALTTIWIAKARPYEMRMSDDDREARLLSVAGNILHTWTAEPPGQIRFAELVKRPAELGGGVLALLGFCKARGNQYPNSLCAFPTEGDFQKPDWERHIETSDMPPKLLERGFTGSEFVVDQCWLFDVFPEVPGDEIVVAHAHLSYSQRAIRIYDRTGNVLYQVWHDGMLKACHWMSEARLLVFAGVNSEEYWESRGYLGLRQPHPCIVFAVQPTLHFIADDYLRSTPGNGSLSPVWYRCLLPPRAVDNVDGYGIRPSSGKHDPGRFVELRLVVDKEANATISWTINKSGDEVDGSRVESDNYKRSKSLHPEEPFRLGPLPPIVEESRPTPPGP